MSKKKQVYEVKLPITGYAYVSVEAKTPEEALEKALDNVVITNIEEWQGCKIVCEGNIFHGDCNEASVIDQDGSECDVDVRTKW